MYLRKKIPEPFHKKSAVSAPSKEKFSRPVEAKEKRVSAPAANNTSPLAALFLLHLLSNKKGDE